MVQARVLAFQSAFHAFEYESLSFRSLMVANALDGVAIDIFVNIEIYLI